MTGLFFNEPLVSRKHASLRELPPIPALGWAPTPPSEWPNLSAAKYIAFDTETFDPRLDDNGPGWGRGDGHIVGISIAAQDTMGNRGAWYFPMRHKIEPHLNHDPQQVLAFTNYALRGPADKIGANLTYDIGWLNEERVSVGGRLYDVQFAEALIDNEAPVALDELARKYLNSQKLTTALYDWIRTAYPHTPETKLRREIHRSPASLVGPYAIADAFLPLEIYQQQEHIIRQEGLDYIFRMECDLIPLMIAMRRRGVRIDMERAQRLYDELTQDTAALYARVRTEYGYDLQSTDSRQLGPFLASLGVPVPRTEAGNYSVQKEWLATLEHPAGELVKDIREHEKITGTFIKSYIFGANVRGRLHPQFHQLHSEDGGTKVGRFSSSDPNLQNIPSRTKLGKKVREAFVADEGHYCWRKFDYSQIHYRLLAHYAVDKGDGSADELRMSYINDPKTDYHMAVYRRVAPFMNWSLTDEEEIKIKRRPIKNVNFGLLYGQSAKSLAYKAGFTDQQAAEFFEAYHKGAPYVKPTMEAIGKEVQEFGYVTTLRGRRIRFHEWEPIKKDYDNPERPLPYNAAIAKWGAQIKRAYEYRGVNYKFQGSEPDIMKSAMRALWQSGVFDYIGVPLITVHDELDFSVPDDSPQTRQAFDFIQQTMQETTRLRIPVFVDESNGPSWGKAD